MSQATIGTPAPPRRPLTGAELARLAEAVDHRLRATERFFRESGVVPVVGHLGAGADHVVVIARVLGSRDRAAAPKAAPAALDHWARLLTTAGYVTERWPRPPALIVRPRLRLSPDELYAAVDARRRSLGLTWQQFAAEAGLTHEHLLRFRARALRRGVRNRIEAWLHRHTALPPTSTPTPQEGAHHGGGLPHPPQHADPHQ